MAAGVLAGGAEARSTARCPPAVPGPVTLTGRLLAPGSAGPVPFAVEGARGCPEERVRLEGPARPGVRRRVHGVRREGWGRGVVVVQADTVLPAREGAWDRARWSAVRRRHGLQERIVRLYGERAGLVSALVLARREGLEREERDAFARAGVAHLLAISGFHVGVVAGLLYALATGLLRGGSRGRARAALAAALGSWAYVGLLGFPDAASRAALILTLVAVARLRGRPAARWAPLAAALLLLLALDPSRLGSVGFQLSFLGAAGLVAARAPLATRLRRLGRGRLPEGLVGGVAAGAAATAATLPAVAWHFEAVSLVGIPATLLASPLVALALPGALGSLALDPVLPGAAVFLAGGVDLLLGLLEEGTAWVGGRSWASAWIPREWTALALTGGGAGWLLARRRGSGAVSRRTATLAAAGALVVGWPLLLGVAGRSTLEIRFLDVGQGDAVALRTPGGSWLLVDAGPPWTGRGPGPVVDALRGRGVGRLEALVLTHPDADHIGQAVRVLSALSVATVLDPGVPVGKPGYVELLEEASARGVPWRPARAPLRWEVDGVALEVLHPVDTIAPAPGEVVDANDHSVVLLVRWGDFEALLTGDAPAAVERAVSSSLPEGGVEVLKVAHHGSDTSTDSLLLARARPELAVVSVGRGNRYGHPSPRVLGRLEGFGVPVRRTDRRGTVRVEARRDGSFRVSGARAPPDG